MAQAADHIHPFPKYRARFCGVKKKTTGRGTYRGGFARFLRMCASANASKFCDVPLEGSRNSAFGTIKTKKAIDKAVCLHGAKSHGA
jgi:hypothetical protein